MLARLELVSDPEISGRFDRLHVEITVELAGGETVTRRCTAPLGSWTRPIRAERIEAKARGLLTEAVGSEQAEAVLGTLTAPAAELSARSLLQNLWNQRKLVA
jgi:aconitate decarboxylase